MFRALQSLSTAFGLTLLNEAVVSWVQKNRDS